MEILDVSIVSKDLEIEKRLAKKLKVKHGKLRGKDDALNKLLKGIPYCFNLSEEHADGNGITKKIDNEKMYMKKDRHYGETSDVVLEAEDPSVTVHEGASFRQLMHTELEEGKSLNRKELIDNKKLHAPSCLASSQAFIPEQSITCNSAKRASHLGHQHAYSDEIGQHRRLVRGLLNRISESNVESITAEVAALINPLSRSTGFDVLIDEVLVSCSRPHVGEQHVTIFAAFVAGVACLTGVDLIARFMVSLATTFENYYAMEDSLSLRNLILILLYLYIFGVCCSGLVYDFLLKSSKNLTEIDVSMILLVLQCCGMKLRSDDPISMKLFLQSIQSRVNEIKALNASGQSSNTSGKRMEFMLEAVHDIKNNKRRSRDESIQQIRIKKWLQKLGIERVLIRGLTWITLLDPNKKGQWWFSNHDQNTYKNVEAVAKTIDKEVLEAQRLLEMAASQRMNTDVRKAIFCIIMSGEDYIDAFRKLLRLNLRGKQEQDIIRVLLECCLQEEVFNKYYSVLASKLCQHDKRHQKTLKYCIWDHFNELDSMPLSRSMHLAKFVAEMLALSSLRLSILQRPEFSDARNMSPKTVMHFRMLFEAIFAYSNDTILSIFAHLCTKPELQALRARIEFFIMQYVKVNRALHGKLEVVKNAITNVDVNA